MCGRFTLTASPQEIERAFDLDETPRLEPRFNIAPTQPVATIDQDAAGRRVLRLRRWGLVPYWAKEPGIGARLINARAETAAEKPAFRDALKHRRCLVPADGFYEWGDTRSGPRQPYHVARPDRGCFAMAGLFERWRAPGGGWLDTCTVLTVPANARLASIHGRMPAILAPEDTASWLDPRLRDPRLLHALLAPCPDAELEPVPVSRRVNRAEVDDPACIAPLPQGAPA